MSHPAGHRRAGLLVPLFSCPSTASWGIGDIGDVEPMTRWLASAGQCVLQLLPLSEMAPGQQSPYSAISAMAIDPIFICVPAVPEFAALGGEAALGPEDRALLDRVRRAPRIEHANVRRLKQAALWAAFNRFYDQDWCRDSARARSAYVPERTGVVDRRLRRVSGDPRARRRTPLDRMAGCAPAP